MHVGTHGLCVRSNSYMYSFKNHAFVFYSPWADARAVRPYMSLAHKSSYNMANHKVQCSKFNVQSQSPYISGLAVLHGNRVDVTARYANGFRQIDGKGD